jgi:DNA-binding NtrC family response regulator
MLEIAEGGSLLLNEIGELPLALQSKLLTFLDTRAFLRVGGQKSVTVDARLMAASHRDLEVEVAEGRFLEPLYYRLAVFTLKVPSLRERTEDLQILVEQIMAGLARRMNRSLMPVVDESTIDKLKAYKWPGNVRELTNTIERALILWDGSPFELDIPSRRSSSSHSAQESSRSSHRHLRDATDELTKSLCVEALSESRGNKKRAAELLGISRDALYRYIRRFRLDP